MAARVCLTAAALSLAFVLGAAGNIPQKVCTFDSTNPALCRQQQASNIVYMGDSTMMKLYEKSIVAPAFAKVSRPCSRTRSRPCNFSNYLGLTQVNASDWVKPGPTVGPACTVHTCNPGCNSCRTCVPQLHQCQNNRTMEYLPVEFARDVEIQTVDEPTKGMTTQQHVGRYLTAHPKDLCVVNTGLHDAKLHDQERVFARNVLVYLELIKPGCTRIVWITTTAVKGVGTNVQNNSIIRLRDNDVLHWLLGMPRVNVVDVFEESKKWEHVDNVHLSHAWYQLLADNLIEY